MKRKIEVFVMAVIAFVLLGFGSVSAGDYGAPDTVWIERIQTVNPNTQVILRIYAFNDHKVQAIQIPFTFPDTTSDMDISLDSISWGTRASSAIKNDEVSYWKDSMQVVDKNRLVVWAIWSGTYLNSVTRAQALATPLVKIYFRTGPSWASPNYVPVDTVTVLLENDPYPPTIVALAFSDSLGGDYMPEFFKGALHVTEIPTPSSLPTVFALYQNYPNPFNATTTIEFDNPQKQIVKVEIVNILGQKVETLVEKELEQKRYRIDWNTRDLSSGPYFCRIQAGHEIKVMKMTLIK
jgi:hypothetical protein